MIRRIVIVLSVAFMAGGILRGEPGVVPDTVVVRSGNLNLVALVWRPEGAGQFPALIFSHGNYATASTPGSVDALLGSVTSASLLGRVFAENGYVFFTVFRRGTGLSKGEGESSLDLLLRTMKERGQEERNSLQVRLLETDQLQDMVSGLRCLKALPGVDTNRIAVLGHSFGGSLALLLAEREPSLKAVVGFGTAAYSWSRSPSLRALLAECVSRIRVPILLVHAQNDYSVEPADSLGAVMDRSGKAHSAIIYPRFGNSTDAGHNFIFLGIPIWKRDVLQFLATSLGH